MVMPKEAPILLLPGMDGTGELLGDLVAELSPHRAVKVIAYPTDKPLSYDELKTFVAKRAPKEPFVVIGESFSGPLAIELAATNPNVIGLGLASSFVRHPLPSFLTPFARIFDMRWVPASVASVTLFGATGTPKQKADFVRVLESIPPEIIQARASAALNVDVRDQLSTVPCPLLCMHGIHDHLVGKWCVDDMKMAHPNCQIAWFNAAHMLLETHSAETAKVILGFCSRIETNLAG